LEQTIDSNSLFFCLSTFPRFLSRLTWPKFITIAFVFPRLRCLRASAEDETASVCSFIGFSPVAGVSLQVTVTACVSIVGALRVSDADATALLARAGLVVDDIANKMTIVVPARTYILFCRL
jgi:hypothetical protein